MGLSQDVRYALRGLARMPGLSAIIIASLALAIGANTTVFTWMEGLVLRPYPAVRDAGQLAWVNTRAPNGDEWSVSYLTLKDWERGARTIEGIGAFDMAQVNLKDGEETSRAWLSMVTGNYFDLLGVPALRGRTLTPEDEASASQVVVLGHDYWQRRFGGDPGVVGRQVALNGNGFTVVGVLPPRFGGLNVGLVFDVFVPVTVQPVLTPGNILVDRGHMTLEAFTRFGPGVTFAQARSELESVAAELGRLHDREEEGILIRHLYERGAAQIMLPVLGALLGVTVLVLLIACSNIANMLLARAGARSKEIAVRLALGAPRRRVVRQLLTESTLLAAAGCAAGLLFAWWGRNGIMLFIPPAPFPISMDFEVNGRVLGFGFGLSALTTLLFGLAPALRASRPELVPILKDEVSGLGVSRSRLRSALVVTQVALSLVSLVCAGLFLRALDRARGLEFGIADPDRLLVVSTDAYLAGYDQVTGPVMAEQLVQRVVTLPGVTHAAFTSHVPLGFGGSSSSSISVEGYTPAADENMSIQNAYATAGLFETTGQPVLAGRGITTQDQAGGQPVLVVNQAFVDRFLKDQDPIGKRVVRAADTAVIVGVVPTGKYQQLTEAARPFLWRPLTQNWRARLDLLVRTSTDPRTLIEPLRREFEAVNAELPFLDPRTMTDQTLPATIGQRIGARMLGLFGGLALLLSALGIYGVMAYTVSLRTREMGIRMALGAAREGVVRLVLLQGARLTLLGLAIGGVLAFGAGTLLRSQLFGVPAGDPLTYAAIGTLLLATALAASAVPALRAARIDPIRALRSE